MVIYLSDANGVAYVPHRSTPNLIEVPAGMHVTCLHVDGNYERVDFIAEGEPIMVALTAIRRIRAQRKAA